MSRKSDFWILILFVAVIWVAPVVICWRKGIAKDDAFQVACIIAAPFIIRGLRLGIRAGGARRFNPRRRRRGPMRR